MIRTLLFFSGLCVAVASFGQATKPRTVITTDGEIDDVDSFVRLLLYANEMNIVGLVYSSSMWHYAGDGRGTTMTSAMPMTRELYGERTDLRWPGTEWMQELIAAYGEVYPVLSTHAEGYPTAESLLQLVRVGNIDFEGAMNNDTEGSDFIRELLLDNDTTTVYLQAWGGTNTIARALKSLEDTYKGTPVWPNLYAGVSSKTVIYMIAEQDATYRDYIATAWPDISVLFYNGGQFAALAYPWQRMVPQPMHYWLEGRFHGRARHSGAAVRCWPVTTATATGSSRRAIRSTSTGILHGWTVRSGAASNLMILFRRGTRRPSFTWLTWACAVWSIRIGAAGVVGLCPPTVWSAGGKMGERPRITIPSPAAGITPTPKPAGYRPCSATSPPGRTGA